MGLCPCPCCLVRKKDIHLLGTPADMLTRSEQPRTDDNARRLVVKVARENIYNHGYVINSVPGVESFLREQSLVPTSVSYNLV
jgi:hypothetical protein